MNAQAHTAGARTPPSLRPWVVLFVTLVVANASLFVFVLHGRVPDGVRPGLSATDHARLDEYVRPEYLRVYQRRMMLQLMVDIRAEMGPAAVPVLVERARDENLNVRRFAIEALGMLGDAAATETLLAAASDPHPLAALSAATALGDVRDPAGRDPLVTLLGHADSRVREAAAASLAFHDLDERHVLALMACADDPAPRVRTAVHATLAAKFDLARGTAERSAAEWEAWWHASGRAKR